MLNKCHCGDTILSTTCFHCRLVARLWESCKSSHNPTKMNLICAFQIGLGFFALMTVGISEPVTSPPYSQAIALSPPVGEGPKCSSATSLKASSLQPHDWGLGHWPEAICVANRKARGEQCKGGKCLGVPEFHERDLCLRSVFSGFLWSPKAFQSYPSITQTPGTGHRLSSLACLGISCSPKPLRVREAGSPERRRREQIYFSPTPPMPT